MDELSAELVGQGLNTRVLGRRIVYYERIGSTNDVARQLAEAGEAEGTLVIADEQSAGRGRFGRAWVAPARSSLLMSLILRPDIPSVHASRVTMAVAVGACDAVRAMTNLPAQIKWHNDLQIRGKKFAGILAESGILDERLEYIIVGIGVNVNFDTTTIEGIPPDATSLAMELGRAVPRAPLARALLEHIEAEYARLCAGEDVCAAYKHRLATLGQFVRAQTAQGIIEGRAVDVDDIGALILERADGSLVQLHAGEVTLVKNGEVKNAR
jgi:BirA family biotin operon repressor/biotin-[acetyl-CoA-carboxylase] ligase